MRSWTMRAGRAAIVLSLLGLVTMSLPMLLTGNPALVVLGPDATPERIEAFLAELNLHDPPPARLADWLAAAVQGDLGTSLVTGRPVADEIARRLPVTLELLVASQVVALAIAVPLAMASAWRPGGRIDRFGTLMSFLLIATPPFIIALGLIALFAVTLGALPATGWRDLWIDPAGHARHLVLPVLATGIAESAVLVRLLRAGLIETLDQPYILAAQSRGMSTPVLLVTRALRPSSFSTLTIVGMTLGLAFGGSVLIESVFAIPGMGQLAMGAIETRDFPVIEAVIIFSGLAVVVASIAVDLIYSLVDPRTRYASR
ncbi:ABC transporter permease [Nocardiopsis composta]|uniref:Peptide/nickel transport system permease protein n=1 Tax=Nocardiopsis composta TaxID=157465 RepID=A0A7W8QHM5_9ACTN|nr:ABC transporter permease [Nocardiopsis composta]MBB5430516.1 peptide/nickel transport system permease protein [Nocardiopsis composta]